LFEMHSKARKIFHPRQGVKVTPLQGENLTENKKQKNSYIHLRADSNERYSLTDEHLGIHPIKSDRK